MSSVSQIAPRAVGRRWVRIAATGVIILGIVGVAIAPVRGYVVDAAMSARPHGPDLALWAGLSLAVKIHLLAALAAIALGAALMWVRKGRLFHRTAGWMWVSLVAVVAGSSLFITGLNHGHFSLLHVLTAWTLLTLPLAVLWAKRHDVARHRRTMMGLFYGGFAFNLLIAFIPGRTLWMLMFG